MNDSDVATDLATGAAADFAAALDEPCVIGGFPIPRGTGSRTGLLLARLGAVMTAIGDERLADADLTGRDYSILAILSDDDPASQHELANLLGKTPAMIVSAIDALEQQALVARTRDPANRRRSRVMLTAGGREALRRADELAEAATANVLSEVSAARSWRSCGSCS